MSFRTVVIKERAKLDLKLNYLVCRNDKEIKVFIPEISELILESTGISLTCALISELVKNNVKIVFCDQKNNPESEVLPYYGNYHSAKRLKDQMAWSDDVKAVVWSEIIKNKIHQQAKLLKELKLTKESDMLACYKNQVEINDRTNREGHSAKVYFNALFGLDFSRREDKSQNSALNYGYAILLSCFNREIVKCGYLTQLGIWHKNEFNDFNLASDFMEPFRVLIDRIVVNLNDEDDFRTQILKIFYFQVKIKGKSFYFENAISLYCKSLFDYLNNFGKGEISFYEI